MKYTLEMDITLPRAKGLFIAAAEKEKECETFSLTQAYYCIYNYLSQ